MLRLVHGRCDAAISGRSDSPSVLWLQSQHLVYFHLLMIPKTEDMQSAKDSVDDVIGTDYDPQFWCPLKHSELY